MSVEYNKAIARRVFEEVFNEGNLDAIDELASVDVVLHVAGFAEPVRGLASFRQVCLASGKAFPDRCYAVEDRIAAGDMVATRWKMLAKHEGKYLGTSPTGKPVIAAGITIYRIVDGKVTEAWVNSDELGLLRQLGLPRREEQTKASAFK
ncbi:MAG: hypothetical protein A2Y60_05625 [Chloroflexi bacterium RBG_13_54_9]|nr:MAG: hypothetical protein A2Y60_05625 [Chloroflexi bacterium RBG_13_54_9]